MLPQPLALLMRVVSVMAVVAVAGCAGPLARSEEESLRDSLIQSHRLRLEQLAAGQVMEVEREPSDVERRLSAERLSELDEMSGPVTYEDRPLKLERDLFGDRELSVVRLSLEEAVQLAVAHNLDLEVARLTPAVAQTQVTQAEGAFDATFFTSAQYGRRHSLTQTGDGFFTAQETVVRESESLELSTGLRKGLTTGGVATIGTTLSRQEIEAQEDIFYEADVMLSLTQPLLRGFGKAANTAEIRLARTARADQREQLLEGVIDIAYGVEQAYWELLLAQHQLRARDRLLERTVAERDRLEQRLEFDVSPVRITEANSYVEQRRADVIRARQNVRVASDRLKRLMNAPGLSVAQETMVIPTDEPSSAPLHFSLPDAVRQALRHRPELQRAMLNIHSAAIRQDVADREVLPQLDLEAAVNFRGLDTGGLREAFSQIDRFDFIDFVIGGRFEYPLGNRQRLARQQQRRLERRQAVLNYQRNAQQAVLEIKNALREVGTQYELIGATRAARRAAANSLRAIQEQEEAGIALTPEFLLDLKLQAQQRLADAEVQEMQARTQYITAIARLYREMGTLLQRNRIDFADPMD